MTGAPISTGSANVRILSDTDYYEALLPSVRTSQNRILCSMFIVDLTPPRDPKGLVYQLLVDCAGAAWRGVDVRILIGGSRTNFEIGRLAAVASHVGRSLGIETRWLTHYDVRGSHMKMVIKDNRVFIGSHNWSVGAFTNQTQDSIAIESETLAEYLTEIFETQWSRADGNVADVQS